MSIRSIVLALSLTIALAGCQSDAKVKSTVADIKLAGQVCDTLSPITYDGKVDSAETKAQIKSYDAKRSAFCNGVTAKVETKK